MIQQFTTRRDKLTATERRKLLENVGHLLNKLRSLADEVGQPLSGQEEDTFWQFIHSLPVGDQTSIIN